MKSVEDLLDELSEAIDNADRAGSNPPRFELRRLQELADRQAQAARRRRTMAIAGACILMLGGLLAVALPRQDAATRVESFDQAPDSTAPVDTTPEAPDDESSDGDSALAENGAQANDADGPTTEADTESQQVEDAVTDVDDRYWIDPVFAMNAMIAVEELVAALTVGDWATAADLWRPDPGLVAGPLPADEQAEIGRLVEFCQDGRCTDSLELIGARGGPAVDGRERAEVFLRTGPDGEPFTSWVERSPVPESSEWRWEVVSEPPAALGIDPNEPTSLFARLFPAGEPTNAALARFHGIDVPAGDRVLRVYGETVVDPWIRRGWLKQEQGWVALDGSGRLCAHPASGTASYITVDVVMLNGRWFYEAIDVGNEDPEATTIFFDCETGRQASELEELGSRYNDSGDIDRRIFSTNGGSVRFLATGNATQSVLSDWRILTATGREVPLADEDGAAGPEAIGTVIYHAETETVAYPVLPSGERPVQRRIEVRSLEDGEILVRFSVVERGAIGYDGRYVTHSSVLGAVGPMDGTLHTPGNRILVFDLATGEQVVISTASTSLFLG